MPRVTSHVWRELVSRDTSSCAWDFAARFTVVEEEIFGPKMFAKPGRAEVQEERLCPKIPHLHDMYVCVCVCVCMYVCTYIHTHTCIHTHELVHVCIYRVCMYRYLLHRILLPSLPTPPLPRAPTTASAAALLMLQTRLSTWWMRRARKVPYLYKCVNAYIHVYTLSLYTCVCVCVCMYVYIYVYIYVCYMEDIYIYIYIRICIYVCYI